MNISDIILQARNVESFSNLLPMSSIQTVEDVANAESNGYVVGITDSAFRSKYPGVDTNHIYISPSFGHAYYWEPDTMVIFPLTICGGEYLSSTHRDLADDINQAKSAIEVKIAKGNYMFIGTALSDRIRMEYVDMLIQRKVPEAYNVFLAMYPISDYGCTTLGADSVKKLLMLKSADDWTRTHKYIDALPEVVTVYRGYGDKSSPLNSAFSWTLDSGVALFFAVRLASANCGIYEARVRRENIFEFFDNGERECLIMPEHINDVKKFSFYDTNSIRELVDDIADMFDDYRETACYDRIPFEQESSVHGMSHSLRVLLYTLILANQYNLDIDDVDILARAALYHDTGRTTDMEDCKHGKVSAGKYKHAFPDAGPVEMFLMKYHCRPDEDGISHIAVNPALASQSERVKHLYDIFKDADALDRFRLGRFELDFAQLRTDIARKMPLLSYRCVDELADIQC